MDSSFLNIKFPKRSIYWLPKYDLIGEVIEPALKLTCNYDLMSAFFNSSSLKELARGFSVFINNPDSKMRLLVSPNFSEKEINIFKSIQNEELYISEWIANKIDSYKTEVNLISNYTIECLAYLIKQNRVELRVACKKNGLFHPKVQLYKDRLNNRIAVHGSNNFTYSGLKNNVENVIVNKSWLNTEHLEIIVEYEDIFEDIWFGTDKEINTYNLDESIKKNILKTYSGNKPTVNIDQILPINENDGFNNTSTLANKGFYKPDYINTDDGDFSHQGSAIKSWEASDFKGILQMATGSGKTITALVAAERLYKSLESLIVIIVVPYKPLLYQWEEICKKFNLEVHVIVGNPEKKFQKIESTFRDVRFGIKKSSALIITNSMIKNDEFLSIIDKNSKQNILLICDEVHNLGTESFLSHAPNKIKYRLGLSATPIRQFDEEGTDKLFEYFGGIVFEFSMEQAIGTCLVPYDYHIHQVELKSVEMDDYIYLTDQIKKYSWALNNPKSDRNGKLDELLMRRRRIIEQADNKLKIFESVLRAEKLDTLSNTLVYASSKNRDQLIEINKLLIEKFKIRTHQLTSEETSKGNLSKKILDQFSKGQIQVLTAMKVLDEGVNLPQIQKAFIIASTTSEREWVQRRGRVLRKSKGKEKAIIHDFLVLPPHNYLNSDVDETSKDLVINELKRVNEFANLSLNCANRNGPFSKIEKIKNKYLS